MTADVATQLAARRLDWIVPEWTGPARVRAFFTTRLGGVSTGPAATFDVGSARPGPAEDIVAITENRRRLRELLPADPVWLHQVHGSDAITIATAPAAPPTVDAAVTRAAATVLTVRTADCLPLLFADRAGTVLAVAHAGWRGLAGGVVESALAAMHVPASEVVAWIGPAIGPRAFEVGADVHAAYCDNDRAATAYFTPIREGKWLADLPGLARARLGRAGVADIAGGHWCTHTDATRFHSYRRDPRAGRMALVAWLAD